MEEASPAEEAEPVEEVLLAEEAELELPLLPQAARLRAMARARVKARNFFILKLLFNERRAKARTLKRVYPKRYAQSIYKYSKKRKNHSVFW